MTVTCAFAGTASREGGGMVISGNMHLSAGGVTFATYACTVRK